MVRALEADLFALRSRPTTAPGTRPEPTDVELPEHEESTAVVVEDTPEEPLATSPSVPAPALASDSAAADPSATRDLDVRSLFEDRADDAAPPPIPPPLPERAAAPVAAAPPIDLSATDAADADVLDDDAFFATLRDAVHDDAPLGPRDDSDITDSHQFFDQDADRGSFRDVFKRRR
jgi:hypothetical protein